MICPIPFVVRPMWRLVTPMVRNISSSHSGELAAVSCASARRGHRSSGSVGKPDAAGRTTRARVEILRSRVSDEDRADFACRSRKFCKSSCMRPHQSFQKAIAFVASRVVDEVQLLALTRTMPGIKRQISYRNLCICLSSTAGSLGRIGARQHSCIRVRESRSRATCTFYAAGTHGRIQEPRQESRGINHQRVAFPVIYRVPGAARFDVVRVLRHIHINRAFQAGLPRSRARSYLLFCVIRSTGPSNVQSKTMLVVSHRKRGLSFALEISRGCFFSSLSQFGPAS